MSERDLLRVLMEDAELRRYDHGGARLAILRDGERELIADFYGNGEWREFFMDLVQAESKRRSAQETSPAPQRMRISYQPQGNCLWHLDCTVANGSGIMSVMAHEDSRSLLECGHCKQRGYYPKGAVGAVCVDVVSAANREVAP